MSKRSFAPFAALGTWLRHKRHLDPFFTARLKIVGLYLVAATCMSIGKGFVTDYSIHDQVYTVAVTQQGEAVQQAFKDATRLLWIERAFFLVIFGLVTIYITDLVLRPIKRSSEIQKRFIATVSHELRTPLTIMQNATEVALRRPEHLTQQKAVSILASNLEEMKRMGDTIQFLIDFSILKERQYALSLQQVSLAALTEEVVELVHRRYPDSGVRLLTRLDDPGMVVGDVSALRSLLYNLIENAVLHTPSGGQVVVAIVRDVAGVRVSVADSGVGIAQDDIPYIFEPFYRVDTATMREVRGRMGLGLSLVKEIVELHGADIRVSSEVHKGTTFTVLFHTQRS